MKARQVRESIPQGWTRYTADWQHHEGDKTHLDFTEGCSTDFTGLLKSAAEEQVQGLVQPLCFSDSDTAGEDCAGALAAALICSADPRQGWKDFPQSPLTLPQSRNPLQSLLAVPDRVTVGTPYKLRQRTKEREFEEGSQYEHISIIRKVLLITNV